MSEITIFEFVPGIILSIVALITTIAMNSAPRTRNIPSLFYICISNYFYVLFKCFDSFSILLNNEILAHIAGLMVFPEAFFLVIGINLTMKNKISSFGLYIIVGLGFILIFLTFQQIGNTILISYEDPLTTAKDILSDISIYFTIIILLYYFYWGVKTWINSPFLIKREALILLIGITLISVNAMILVFLGILFGYYLVFSSYISTTLGLILFMIAILKEPKLLYILPFKVYRLIVKDKNGYLLFSFNWSESYINNIIFTEFLNRIQFMSEEIIDRGELLNIHLRDGLLILNESKYITVGLIASKSSKLLRTSLNNFATDFEVLFKRLLKKFCIDMEEYKSSYRLIEKHFSNFPYKTIKSKKQPLLLNIEENDIPINIKKQLENVFDNESEYNSIKSDIIDSPNFLISKFFDFYDEMKQEIEDDNLKTIE
ncbi:MAG: hypothetical protein JXA99_08790 [Candidatus Lokiarchaeota archaeon]|nr:hypothetical protein [Candidatus Lokiarchaeota archaeon]